MLASAKHQLEELKSRHQIFSSELDPAQESRFLDFYVQLITRVLDAERCSIFVVDPANSKIWLKAGTEVKERGIEVPMDGSIVGESITSGKAVIRMDLQRLDGMHKVTDATTGFVTREVICVPIRSTDGQRVTGAIEVLNKKDGDRFTEEDQQFLTKAGDHFQGILESIFAGQEALQIAQHAVGSAGRAMVQTLVASGTVVFVIAAFMLVLRKLSL